MGPEPFLAAFCSALSTIAVARLIRETDTDAIDSGTAVLVVGITLLTIRWAVVETSTVSQTGSIVLAILAVAVIVVGARIVVTNWSDDRGFDAGSNECQ